MARHDWRTIPLAVLAGILLAACSAGDEDALAAESGSDETAIPQVADDSASGSDGSGTTVDAGNSTSEPPSTPADVTPTPPSQAPETGAPGDQAPQLPQLPSVDPQPPVDQPEDPPMPETPSTGPDQPMDPPGNPQPPEDQPEIPNVPETPSTDPEPPVESAPDPELPAEATEPEPKVNNPPSISGSATASTMVGVAYSFTPIAADPDGDALSWSITGKPTGATFSPVTGKLDWTPQSAGVWNNIVVTVTDSEGASVSLPAFSITVEQPVVSGTAALRWEAPVKYSDGSALPANVLAGYRIYHGTSESSLARIAEVDSLTNSLTFADLEKGTHYFAVMAFSDSGDEGERSAILSKSIP